MQDNPTTNSNSNIASSEQIPSHQLYQSSSIDNKSATHLQEKIFPCICQIYEHFHSESQKLKSIHDLFNSQTFHQLLLSIVPKQKYMASDLSLRKSASRKFANSPTESNQKQFFDESTKTYEEQKIDNFKQIWSIISEYQNALQLNIKTEVITDKDIQNMVKNYDLNILRKFIEHMFSLVIYNPEILEFITSLNENTQSQIKDLLQSSACGFEGKSQFENSSGSLNNQNTDGKILGDIQSSTQQVNSLKLISTINQKKHAANSDINSLSHIEQLQAMQSHLLDKDDQIKCIKLEKLHVQEQLTAIQKENEKLQEELENLQGRMASYEEIDILMQEKDQEILKLNKRVAELQVKLKARQANFKVENKKLSDKVSTLQGLNYTLTSQSEKLKSSLESVKQQKQESEMTMKKVIANLKERASTFSEKMNELQQQLIEANFEKQLKEKELDEARSVILSYRKASGNGQNQYFDKIQLNSPRSPIQFQRNSDQNCSSNGNVQPHPNMDFDNLSVLCSNQTQHYSKLGEQLGEFINSSALQKTQFEEELALYSQGSDAANKKFAELLRQNYKMKQQIQLNQIQLSSMGNSTGNNNENAEKQIKDLKDELSKTKKKVIILKRRNDELDQLRKDEIDIMIGSIEYCYGQISKESNVVDGA